MDELARLKILYSEDKINKLKNQKIMLFGLGGVGGYVLETLARSGISSFVIIDGDSIEESNINRQIIATKENIGESKVIAFKKRLLAINPDIKVEMIDKFIHKDDINSLPFDGVNYVIDCIDTISTKIALAKYCFDNNIKIISAMGAGNKFNPMGFIESDIYKTEVDPIAKKMRGELRKLGVDKLKVVYSKEVPQKNDNINIGSNAFVPASMGIYIASIVFKDLLEDE